MLKKLLIAGGIGLVTYVINEVRKQYDQNVNDYNTLLEKFNNLTSSDSEKDNSRYQKETEVMPDGREQIITRDITTGFSLITTKGA